MPTLSPPSHEAFAQARAAGKGLTDASSSADLASTSKSSASRLQQLPAIQQRIAEIQHASAEKLTYDKTHLVRDLIAIIHTPPSEIGPDHPLCEMRLGKDGPIYRLPSKLTAMARLIKLMGWTEPETPGLDQEEQLSRTLVDIHDPAMPKLREACAHSAIFQETVIASFQKSLGDPCDTDGFSPNGLPPDAPYPRAARFELLLQLIARDRERQAARKPDSDPDPKPKPTPPLPNVRQEAFAQARFQGLGIMAAYQAVGYRGAEGNCAWRINDNPQVKARIATLNRAVESDIDYHRDDVIRDLVQIVHAPPSSASPHHPLCEMRTTSWGPYHRFPSKLAALTLLLKLLWPQPPNPPRS